MARLSESERLESIHQEALKEFDAIQSVMRDERLQCLKDRRFYSIPGAQWEGSFGEQFENKPKLEVNKIHLSVMRIINEFRNNRITVDFVSKDGAENKMSEVCDSLYRADEKHSVADEAYDNAFEEAVGGGFGAWRLRNVYEDEYDEEDDRQRICIEPIHDADSTVFFDLNAKRQDKADARSCYVLTAMTRESYIEQWKDDPATWPHAVSNAEFDWATPDTVYVAEYYKVEDQNETVRIFENIDKQEERYSEQEFEDDEDLESRLRAIGTKQVGERRVRRRKVHKYIMSGSGVLEDAGCIAGTEIPIVPVYGKRWFVDNIERCMGHVRLAVDAQRLKNMQLSKLGEIAALAPAEKPIFTPEQVSGHEQMWAKQNVENYPYFLVNPITDANGMASAGGPVGYTKPPDVPPALAVMLQATEQDMTDILGRQEAGEEVTPNISGKAIELIQQRLDMQTFIYMSNMAKAVRRSGEIWLSMAREILVEPGRKMKALGRQGEVRTIELNKKTLSEETGAKELENNMSAAKLDVIADVGPSSTSRRAAAVRSLTGMIQMVSDPETRSVLIAMAMMNMEGEGIGDARKFFREKLVKMGVIDPTKEEAIEMMQTAQSQQPDPQAIANAAYLQAEANKAEAQGIKAQADAEHTVARTEETRAKTAERLSSIDLNQLKSALDIAEELQEFMQSEQGTREPSLR